MGNTLISRAIITNCHNLLVTSNNRNLLFYCPGGQKSIIKASTRPHLLQKPYELIIPRLFQVLMAAGTSWLWQHTVSLYLPLYMALFPLCICSFLPLERMFSLDLGPD